ncbi:uncharacterized protein LOC128397930 [Panonychus citri]|uniref:uncharacterized protein LOC128397930 n=1 Tax=Panonychus citri TaxID=50023 RepID=UPI002307DBF6|nr:uncharacterized protein LOC128397930 [Panonychus citri]
MVTIKLVQIVCLILCFDTSIFSSAVRGKLRSNVCLIEGDIRCPKKGQSLGNRKQRSGITFTSKRSYSNGPRDSSTLWPTRLIPYKFSYDYTGEQSAMIQRAISEIESSTCVRFVPITGQKFSDYVIFMKGKGCYSDVGRIGGEQQISLDLECFNEKTIRHELLHTLGFWHEHNRPDRDKYVKVIRENIDPVKIGNFEISPEYTAELGPWEYDYYSVLHFKSTDYSRDGKSPTLLPVDPNIRAESLGSSMILTKQDIDKINYIYRCELKSCPIPTLNDHVTFITPPAIENEYKIGSKVSYSCDSSGYTMIGSISQTCLSTGLWSGLRPRCLPVVSHYCNFESNGLCGWTQVEADTEWEKATGRSSYRTGTGPIIDLTSGTLDGHYLKLDSQNLDPGSRALISTPKLPLPSKGTSFCLNFGYYMWGLVVGSLRVTLYTDSGTSTEIFTASGSQGPKWIEKSLIFSPDSSFKIEFEGTIGSELGDIAIDDVSIEPCSSLKRPITKRPKTKFRLRFT